MKTALILEGGGMRGAYTCGVLDFLLDQNIEFDTVIGVSAGACHACSFVSRQRGRAFRTMTNWLHDKDYMSVYSLLKNGNLFNPYFMYDRIPNQLDLYDYKTFNQSNTKLYAVCTDCESGQAMYVPIIHMQQDIKYVQASASLPLVSQIVEHNHKKMLDGGISDSIPIEFILEKGYDRVVVVLTRKKGYQKKKNSLMPLIKKQYKNYPNLVKACQNRHIVYNRQLELLSQLEKQKKIFCVYPSQIHIGKLEKNIDKLQELYDTGYSDIHSRQDELLKYLEKGTIYE